MENVIDEILARQPGIAHIIEKSDISATVKLLMMSAYLAGMREGLKESRVVAESLGLLGKQIAEMPPVKYGG